jgi:hypothetical protein
MNVRINRNTKGTPGSVRKLTKLTDNMLRVDEDLKSAHILMTAIDPQSVQNTGMTEAEVENASVEVLEAIGRCVDDISQSMDFIIKHPEYSRGDLHELCMKNYERCERTYSGIRKIRTGTPFKPCSVPDKAQETETKSRWLGIK